MKFFFVSRGLSCEKGKHTIKLWGSILKCIWLCLIYSEIPVSLKNNFWSSRKIKFNSVDKCDYTQKISWRSNFIWLRNWSVLPGNTFGYIRHQTLLNFNIYIYTEIMQFMWVILFCIFDGHLSVFTVWYECFLVIKCQQPFSCCLKTN